MSRQTGIQLRVVVPQVAVIAFAASHTWAAIAFTVSHTQAIAFTVSHTQAAAFAANHTWAAIEFTVSLTQAVPSAADHTQAVPSAADHTQAIPFAADHTQAVVVLAATHTSVAILVPNHTQAVATMAASHTQVAVALVVTHTQAVIALVTNHTQAIVALVAVMGMFDPAQAGMVRKAIVAIEVSQTNEDDRAQQAEILTSQSLDLDKWATLMKDHSKNLADTMAILESFQGSQLATAMDIVAQAIQAIITMAMATLEDESMVLAITPVSKFALMDPKASNDLDPKDLSQFMRLNSAHHVLLMLLEIKVDGILSLFSVKKLAFVQSLALDALTLIKLETVQSLALGISIEMASLEFVKNQNRILDGQVLLNLVFTIYQSNLNLKESLDIYQQQSYLQMSTADTVIETKTIHLYQKSLQLDQVPNMAYLIPWVSRILDANLIDDLQKNLVGQRSNMACQILLVSKILGVDLIDDFLMFLDPFMATVFAINNLDSSFRKWHLGSYLVLVNLDFSSHNFKQILDSYLVFATLDFSSHNFKQILESYPVLKIPFVTYSAFTSN